MHTHHGFCERRAETMLLVTGVITSVVLVILYLTRGPHGANANLGVMSERWLAEHRQSR